MIFDELASQKVQESPQKTTAFVPPSPASETDGAVRFRAVVVGNLHEIPYALQHPAIVSRDRFDVVGVVHLDGHYAGIPASDVAEQVRINEADTILVAGAVGRMAMDALGELAITLGCRLLALIPTTLSAQLDPVIIWEGEHPLIQMAISRDHQLRTSIKRAMDIAFSLLGLIVAIPVLLVAALAIRIESGGSPLFGHVRVGRGGRRFRCWKLRTMTADAELRLQQDSELFAAYQENDFKLPEDSDPRVTRVGRLLRQSSIDELPQLWNVLVGDMSLVGPRPLVADELRHYAGEVLTLLSVRPGLTGAWAVSGRHHLAYPRRAEIELAYVRKHSLRRDLRILFRTASAVFDPGIDPQPEKQR